MRNKESLNTPPALRAAPRPALLDLDARLIPDEIEAPLKQRRETPHRLWHEIQPAPSILVSLWSRSASQRVLTLTVASDAPGWNPLWARWTVADGGEEIAIEQAVGEVADAAGGEAPAFAPPNPVPESVPTGAGALTLSLPPGEQRDVTLEFRATLDGQTRADDYLYEVVITDGEAGAETRLVGVLHLRHPASALLERLPGLYTPPAPPALSQLAVYEEIPFFVRWLRGFEDVLEPLHALLATRAQLFDPRCAPTDFLPWLATWVALALDENWPELKRRRLIGEAVELYRWRGTRRGLTRYLEIYAGVAPQISDTPLQGMRLGASARLGRSDARLGDVPPHTFVVTLAVPDPALCSENIVRAIIESEKPAHTAYQLRIVQGVAAPIPK